MEEPKNLLWLKKTNQPGVLEMKVSKHTQYLKVMHLTTANIEDMSVTARRFIPR